jgi:hypothetical protein
MSAEIEGLISIHEAIAENMLSSHRNKDFLSAGELVYHINCGIQSGQMVPVVEQALKAKNASAFHFAAPNELHCLSFAVAGALLAADGKIRGVTREPSLVLYTTPTRSPHAALLLQEQLSLISQLFRYPKPLLLLELVRDYSVKKDIDKAKGIQFGHKVELHKLATQALNVRKGTEVRTYPVSGREKVSSLEEFARDSLIAFNEFFKES